MSEPKPTQAAKTMLPTTLPYWRRDEAALLGFESEPESELELSSPPRPSNTWPALGVADAPVAEGVLTEDDVVLFTRVGFKAPHG